MRGGKEGDTDMSHTYSDQMKYSSPAGAIQNPSFKVPNSVYINDVVRRRTAVKFVVQW